MIPLQETAMLRESKTKKGFAWWLECLIFIAVFIVAQIIMAVPVGVAEMVWLFPKIFAGEMSDITSLLTDMPDWMMLVNLFATALMTLTAILFCLLLQKRKPTSLGFRRKNAVREYLIGALIGAGLFSVAIGICCATGSVRLTASPFSVGTWLLFLIGFLIQGMSEEVLCRGYFMGSVCRRNPIWLAVLLNSVLFSLLHIFNGGVTFLALLNIALFGVLISLYVLRRGDLWGACAMHSLWNFVQGNVFGVSVSGTGSGASPLSAELTGSALWNGGSFGLEGGLAVTIVLAAGILILLFLIPNAKEEQQPQTV